MFAAYKGQAAKADTERDRETERQGEGGRGPCPIFRLGSHCGVRWGWLPQVGGRGGQRCVRLEARPPPGAPGELQGSGGGGGSHGEHEALAGLMWPRYKGVCVGPAVTGPGASKGLGRPHCRFSAARAPAGAGGMARLAPWASCPALSGRRGGCGERRCRGALRGCAAGWAAAMGKDAGTSAPAQPLPGSRLQR